MKYLYFIIQNYQAAVSVHQINQLSNGT
jgi:hypothetical protein